jgi:hypothetical protein
MVTPMPELITRCDYCDVQIPYGAHWEVEIRRAFDGESDRWTLCRNCCVHNTIQELANTIDNKTNKAAN